MKTLRLLFLGLAVLLTPVSSYGQGGYGFIEFPGADRDGTPFALAIYQDHITITGSAQPGSGNTYLPLQYAKAGGSFVGCGGTGAGAGQCFTVSGSSKSSVDIAIRNAWIAALLQARTTGKPVFVYWGTTADQTKASGCTIAGCIFTVIVPGH